MTIKWNWSLSDITFDPFFHLAHQPIASLPMAFTDQRLFQAINQIAEALSSCERRRLFYLCEDDTVTDPTVVSTKEMLKRKVMHLDTSHQLLVELMWHLRRFDILRKVFHTSRDEVERTLAHRKVLSRFRYLINHQSVTTYLLFRKQYIYLLFSYFNFRILMAHLSEEVTEEELRNMIFLLNCTLSREKIEKAKVSI